MIRRGILKRICGGSGVRFTVKRGRFEDGACAFSAGEAAAAGAHRF